MYYPIYKCFVCKCCSISCWGGGGAVAPGGAHFQRVPHGSLLREDFGFQRATGATAPPPAPPILFIFGIYPK